MLNFGSFNVSLVAGDRSDSQFRRHTYEMTSIVDASSLKEAASSRNHLLLVKSTLLLLCIASP